MPPAAVTTGGVQVAEIDRKLKVQIQALEDGMDAELVSARIAELRTDKETFAAAPAEIGEEQIEQEDDYLYEQLARLPDLTDALRTAPPEVKRQTFDAFDLRIDFDKAAGRIEISATVSQLADAFENTKALQSEGFDVTARNIAGAGFEPATFGLCGLRPGRLSSLGRRCRPARQRSDGTSSPRGSSQAGRSGRLAATSSTGGRCRARCCWAGFSSARAAGGR
jgi:hypothetical protein